MALSSCWHCELHMHMYDCDTEAQRHVSSFKSVGDLNVWSGLFIFLYQVISDKVVCSVHFNLVCLATFDGTRE